MPYNQGVKPISGSDATTLALIAANPHAPTAQTLAKGLSPEAQKIAKAVVAPTTRNASGPVKETARAIRRWANQM
jgi:hypothetical protein